MHRLEQLRATFDEGPCMDAYRSGRFAGEPDLVNAQERWPCSGRRRWLRHRRHVQLSVHVGDLAFGALDSYRVRPGALTPSWCVSTRVHTLSLDEVAARVIDGRLRIEP
jgi:hypothetical protein